MDGDYIRNVCIYILRNVNEDMSVSSLAKVFYCSKFYLMKQFKEYTGFTINEFINECRVYNSTEMLIFTDDTILKIALGNGFHSQEYYSEKFKDVIGVSPLRFRKFFAHLSDLINETEDVESLKVLREELGALDDYRQYLNNIDQYVCDDEREKPSVYVFKAKRGA